MARAASSAKPHVAPVFPPKLESRTRESLSVFLMQMGLLPDAHAGQLQPLRACIDAMVDSLFDGEGTAFDLEEAIPVRDHQYAHPAKVAELTMILAKLAGGQRTHVRAAGTAALLMNLGYAQIRAAILDNAGAVDAEDLAAIREHPAAGAHMLEHGDLGDDVLAAIASHHERWDGSGYPAGVSRGAIPTYARIIAVADTWIALVSPRPYRGPTRRDAIETLFRTESGTLFDPRVVRLLLDEMPEQYDT